MFRRNTPQPEVPVEPESERTGKGRATPSRREQEAARKRPLVPSDRRQATRDSRARLSEERIKAREGMAAGDERYLTARDRGPQKRHLRDIVDARFSVGEVLIPVLLVVVFLSFIPAIQSYGTVIMMVFFLLIVVDCLVLYFQAKKRLEAKFGTGQLERGLLWYASMRAIQLRPMRLPKPQVKRGQYPS